MFAYPLIHDLVAGSGEEKAEAEELVDSIVGMSLLHFGLCWCYE